MGGVINVEEDMRAGSNEIINIKRKSEGDGTEPCFDSAADGVTDGVRTEQ